MSPKLVRTYPHIVENRGIYLEIIVNCLLCFSIVCFFRLETTQISLMILGIFMRSRKKKEKNPKIDEGQIKIVNGFVLALIPITSQLSQLGRAQFYKGFFDLCKFGIFTPLLRCRLYFFQHHGVSTSSASQQRH